MTSSHNYLSDVFPEPPLIGFRRQKNIREVLIKAKVSKPVKLYERRAIIDVFPEPHLIGFRRQKNIRELLIRAKVSKPVQLHERRAIICMKKYNKPCGHFVEEKKVVKGDTFLWQIRKHLNCQTKKIIYMIECNKDSCKAKYMGKTQRTFSERIYDHMN